MSLKNTRTTTTYVQWDKAMMLINKLQNDNEHKFAALLGVGMFTACRISDILMMKYEDLLYQTELEITEKKTKKYRKIRINPDLQKIIQRSYKELKPESPKELIFLNKYKSKAISTQYINQRFKEIARKYKVNELTSTHSMRKTFCVGVYNRNKSSHTLVLLSHLLSHSSVAMTRIYLGLREEEMMNVYDELSMF